MRREFGGGGSEATGQARYGDEDGEQGRWPGEALKWNPQHGIYEVSGEGSSKLMLYFKYVYCVQSFA